jgi:uncharacterized protein YegL
MNFAKVEREAPGLVPLAKSAAVSLAKHDLQEQRAAVYLVLDHSGSMRPYYQDGSVQRLAEQALALCAHLDDDGTVPVVFFGSRATPARELRLADHAGAIDRLHRAQPWGTTNYGAAILEVVDHYKASGTADPALVIFQTDGAPDVFAAAERALAKVSRLPLFFAFVGFGRDVAFLFRLDELKGRFVDNASAFHALLPLSTPDEELYDGLLREFPAWLAASRAAGVR